MRDTEGFEDFEHFEGGKLGKMEKMDLSGHQCGILKLTRRTVVVPFESIFGMKMVDSQDEKQKHKQEGDIESFSVCWGHRILCAYNIRKRKEKSQPVLQLR
jgi:hypothetical protein